MSRILIFFIPIILKSGMRNFLFAALACLTVKFLPTSLKPIEFLVNLAAVGLFVIMSFLSQKTYLPFNMNWIINTPNSVSSLFFANGLLNFFKTIYYFILSCVLLIIIFFEQISKASNKMSLTKSATLLDSDSSSLNLTLIACMIVALVILFGMIDHARLEQLRRERLQYVYKTPLSHYFLAFGLFSLVGILMTSIEVPGIILMGFIFSVAISFVTQSTLSTLRLYSYSDFKFISIIFCSLLLVSTIFLYNSITQRAMDPNRNLADRLSDLDLLTDIDAEPRKLLLSELYETKDNLKDLRLYSLKRFFINEEFKTKELSKLLEKILIDCQKREDYTCRIAAHLTFLKDGKNNYDLLKKSCPRDIQSCSLLSESKVESDRNLGIEFLTKDCPKPENVNTSSCRTFNKKSKM